jgi:hypothetical protein
MGALVLSTSTAAFAQPAGDTGEPSQLDRRDRSSLSASVGVAAPTGSVGIEYGHALHSNFEIAAGVGIGYLLYAGLSDDYRPTGHAMIMPRARVRFGALRLHAGAGVSGGQEQFGYSPFADEMGVDRLLVLWGHAEAGVALVSDEGWFGRATVGASHTLAKGAAVSTDPGRTPMEHDVGVQPYLGLAFGRSL